MKRPRFFEDLDKSLEGIDVEALCEQEERERAEILRIQREAQMLVSVPSPMLTTSLVAPSWTFWEKNEALDN